MWSITHAKVVTPRGVIDRGTVVVDAGRVLSVAPMGPMDAQGDGVIDVQGAYVTPGLVDIQVNGGGGHMFSTDIDGLKYERILAAHASLGTTSVCPTVITGPIQRMVDAVGLASRFADVEVSSKIARVVGVHVEGPFLSEKKRGAHDAEHLLLPSIRDGQRLVSAGNGHVRIVTLAPELSSSDEVIRFLVNQGVLVSLGHSSASAEEFLSAFRAGARGSTHLFNAMEGMSSRSPGGVGATLVRPDVYAGLIGDLLHVNPVSIKAALNARGTDTTYLTTDAVAPLGHQDSTFDLYGVEVTVRNGGCYTSDGTLAGTATSLAQMVKNMVTDVGLDFSTAIKMATMVPAAAIGKSDTLGALQTGRQADLVIWSDELVPVSVWIDGTEISGSLSN